MFEFASESEWASRIHIAKKVKRGAEQDDGSFGIRVCGDYVQCNSQCVPLQANAPDVPDQIGRAAGGAAFWYTDGHAQ